MNSWKGKWHPVDWLRRALWTRQCTYIVYNITHIDLKCYPKLYPIENRKYWIKLIALMHSLSMESTDCIFIMIVFIFETFYQKMWYFGFWYYTPIYKFTNIFMFRKGNPNFGVKYGPFILYRKEWYQGVIVIYKTIYCWFTYTMLRVYVWDLFILNLWIYYC